MSNIINFAKDKPRFGSINHDKTSFHLIAVALTLHYLCKRY